MHDFLRNEYGYTGIIITDDLAMDAITKYAENSSAGVLAALAGNDILLTSFFVKHINQVIKAYEDKEIDEELINKAARRVIAWKLKYLYKIEVKPNDDNFNDDSDDTLFIIIGITIGILAIIIIFLIYFYYIKKNKTNNKTNNKDVTPIEEEIEKNPEERLVRDSTQSERETQNANQ